MSESHSKKPSSFIALIAGTEADRQFFKGRLSAFPGLDCQFFSSIRQFKSQCPGARYSCLMIEIKTLFKSTPSEKRFFNFLLDQFSVMRVRVNSDKGDFSGFVENMELTGLSGDQVLELFLRDICAKQAPRGIRMEGRTSVHLSVYLDYTDADGQARRIKATTLDVSEGGCFIVTHHEFNVDDEIHLIFTEPADFSPIPCRVRRVKPWRVDSRHLPGVGLAFTDIDKSQLACLLDLPG